MQAACRHEYGPPDTIALETVPRPVPQDNELLVRVHCTTVNRTDCANLTGRPLVMHLVLGLRRPRRARIGTDFAGEVVATGPGVRNYRVGDRVCGFRDTGLGGHAEYVCLPEDGPLLPVPEGVDLPTAVAALEGGHYAYTFLRRTELRPGERLLINGATRAIGSALLQFVAHRGAHITATCRPEHRGRVLALGADRVIDYTREDFTRGGETYDHVLDAVGKSTFGRCRPLLSARGTYTSSEPGPWWQNPVLALLTPLGRGRQVGFPVPFSYRESFPYLRKCLERGTYRPLIDLTFPLREIAEAYRYVLSGQKVGSVILTVHS
ncbi:NAD(P)-dependent alcohol dehydrogenase [Lewinella sp. IMCC34183]|uniref:NAD(P)-dependent alcohol dehydrogenase n=1 Tax=Lewinella sp. IMCC34183 TaxID=2248762 RepID=UPI000E25602D|nr:NAD(P)-dependent alcohol dehydrogenase [Lewinella sp. IMCC34183]